jgi:hypothetical protein
MSKVHIGVGDEFPLEDARQDAGYACGGRWAHWERRRAYWAERRAARRERWAAWCAFWHGAPKDAGRPAAEGDASSTDVPPRKDGEA